jgi:uncharacterized membrane protein
MESEEKFIKEELRREFQLERMILFSDAVFAIAITLMAIEIRLPEHSTETVAIQLLQLLPTILAYIISFGFIGHLWYQHLHIFGLLKDFDKGLVVRNLLMLFFIGFFPFSVTLIASKSTVSFLPVIIYFLIIVFCKGAQINLEHYILVMRPNLRIHKSVVGETIKYKQGRLALIMLLIVSILTISTLLLIKDPNYKNFAWWWFMPFPFVLKYFQKRIK